MKDWLLKVYSLEVLDLAEGSEAKASIFNVIVSSDYKEIYDDGIIELEYNYLESYVLEDSPSQLADKTVSEIFTRHLGIMCNILLKEGV